MWACLLKPVPHSHMSGCMTNREGIVQQDLNPPEITVKLRTCKLPIRENAIN